MTVDRWTRIGELYDAARRLPLGDRHSFLHGACGGDTDLYREIASLLEFDEAAGVFLERPALEDAASAVAADLATLTPGTVVAGYRIRHHLGSGGMGDVYCATEIALERDVALKILDISPGDDLALRRFEDEARAASALVHPGIVTIYGVARDRGVALIAMELVQGRTLRDTISDGPLPVETALEVAVQLAAAVSAAHRAGVVHRDLKPENIMIAPGGLLKVLDFGIAKRQGTADGGFALGTAGYMAPEQRAGQVGDARSDQFALGAVVYEMFTGHRAAEASALDLPRMPAAVRRQLIPIVRRALATDPAARFDSVAEYGDAVQRVREDDRLRGHREHDRRRFLVVTAAAAAGVLAAGALSWRWYARTEIRSLAILPFQNESRDPDLEYLSEGLSGDLIELLASPSLALMARSTVSHFSPAADPVATGRALHVQAVLHGTFGPAAGGLHVTADLIDVSTGATIWNRTYDRAANDIAAVRADIVRALSDESLHLAIDDRQRQRLARRLSVDSEAYDAYLRGLRSQRTATEQGYREAVVLLERSVAGDPDFAEGFAALAATYSMLALDGYIRPADAWAAAAPSLRQALALDADLPNAHAELATYLLLARWDFRAAEHEWEMALRGRAGEAQPDFLEAYALECWAAGRIDFAVALVRRARAIDPFTPTFATSEADFLLAGGHFDDAARLYEEAIHENADAARAYSGLAEVRKRQERYGDAIQLLRAAYSRVGREALVAAVPAGRDRQALERLERAGAEADLEALRSRAQAGGYVSPLDVARVHARLGDVAQALACFPQAFAERSPGLVFLGVDRVWEPLRGEPAFRSALAQVVPAT